MSARPAVTWGTKTWQRPFPRSEQKRRTASVRSVIGRAPVSTADYSQLPNQATTAC